MALESVLLGDPAAALVGQSAVMRQLRATLRRAAAIPTTVLFTGETGTGKTAAARAIHALSPAAQGPFVTVDCASLAPTLLEAELFGNEAGAFTGARARRRGRAERAGKGTLFLDEVAELELPLQAKLLRLLQDRAFERVGGSETLPLRARLVAATNLDLERAVRSGRFRADLFYRLDVVRIHLPPLRERLDDLPLLVGALLERISSRLGLVRPEVPNAFVTRLLRHPWPGNVRELSNVLERALVLARDLRHDPLAFSAAAMPAVAAGPGSEELLIQQVLRATGGNISRAARRLGLPRTTLRRRIERYGLARFVPRD